MLNSTGKILEKIIYNRLQNVIDQHKLIPNCQFGFRKGHSTVHQALRIKKFIESNKHNRKSTGMMLLDIEKAFDSIWHDGLIYKLIKFKVPSFITKMIDAFIRKRSFTVVVNDNSSNEISIPAGLAQGTCLSPILYALYVADIPTPSDSMIALYADDTAVYTAAKQSNTIVNRLNAAMKTLQFYFSKWRIKINDRKTQAILFPFNNSFRRRPTASLDQDIILSKTVKYLGIYFDSKLNFKQHVTETVIKSNNCFRAVYPLIARKSQLSTENKQLIFTTIIRAVMAFGSPVWSSAAFTHVSKLIILQNKTLKIIHKLNMRTPTTILETISETPRFDTFITNYNASFLSKCSLSQHELIREITCS